MFRPQNDAGASPRLFATHCIRRRRRLLFTILHHETNVAADDGAIAHQSQMVRWYKLETDAACRALTAVPWCLESKLGWRNISGQSSAPPCNLSCFPMFSKLWSLSLPIFLHHKHVYLTRLLLVTQCFKLIYGSTGNRVTFAALEPGRLMRPYFPPVALSHAYKLVPVWHHIHSHV